MRYNNRKSSSSSEINWDTVKDGDTVMCGNTPCLILRRDGNGNDGYKPRAMTISIANARHIKARMGFIDKFIAANEKPAEEKEYSVKERALWYAERNSGWTWQQCCDAATSERIQANVVAAVPAQTPSVSSVGGGGLRSMLARMNGNGNGGKE